MVIGLNIKYRCDEFILERFFLILTLSLLIFFLGDEMQKQCFFWGGLGIFFGGYAKFENKGKKFLSASPNFKKKQENKK